MSIAVTDQSTHPRHMTWSAIGLAIAIVTAGLIPHLLSLRTGPGGGIGGLLPIVLTATAGIVILMALWTAIAGRYRYAISAGVALIAIVCLAAMYCVGQNLPILASPTQRAAVAATKATTVFGQGGADPAPRP